MWDAPLPDDPEDWAPPGPASERPHPGRLADPRARRAGAGVAIALGVLAVILTGTAVLALAGVAAVAAITAMAAGVRRLRDRGWSGRSRRSHGSPQPGRRIRRPWRNAP